MKDDEKNKNYRFTAEEAAIYLGYTTGTLANLRYKRTGPKFYKPLGKIFYYRKDLDAWIKQQ